MLNIVEKGQFFITLDEEEGTDGMKNSCREYTLSRSEPESGPRGWIVGSTKIGPVLDVKVCFHKKRYGIEIMIESLFPDTGKSALCTAHVEEVSYPRKGPNCSTRRTMTPYIFAVT